MQDCRGKHSIYYMVKGHKIILCTGCECCKFLQAWPLGRVAGLLALGGKLGRGIVILSPVPRLTSLPPPFGCGVGIPPISLPSYHSIPFFPSDLPIFSGRCYCLLGLGHAARHWRQVGASWRRRQRQSCSRYFLRLWLTLPPDTTT